MGALLALDLAFVDTEGANIGLGVVATLLLAGAGVSGLLGLRETRDGRQRGRWLAVAALALSIAWVLVFLVIPSIWLIFDGELPIENW